MAALNNFASLLATCSEESIRDGPKAVEYAEREVAISGSGDNVDTLVAAHAEAGQYEKTVRMQERVIS